jgi:hypothetical protein
MNFLNKPRSDILLQIGVLEEKKEERKTYRIQTMMTKMMDEDAIDNRL